MAYQLIHVVFCDTVECSKNNMVANGKAACSASSFDLLQTQLDMLGWTRNELGYCCPACTRKGLGMVAIKPKTEMNRRKTDK